MKTVSYSKFTQNMTEVMNQSAEDHAPIIISRQNQPDMVLMSLNDFQGYEETFYLMQSAENVRALNKSIEEKKAGLFIERDLIELC